MFGNKLIQMIRGETACQFHSSLRKQINESCILLKYVCNQALAWKKVEHTLSLSKTRYRIQKTLKIVLNKLSNHE